MKILWITARDLSRDLAKSTELGIARSLYYRGNTVTIISPGIISFDGITHHNIKTVRFPGLNTISGARNIRKFLKKKKDEIEENDLLFVDWRYVPSLRVFLESTEVPWCIVDRGPPADRGILKVLQKGFWKRAWEIADKFATGGFTVSNMHTEFVRERNGVNMRIFQIPAGSESNAYLENKTDPTDCLRVVYIGRLDKRRGVEEIIRLSELLENSERKFRIDIYGEGDLSKSFERYGRKSDTFNYHGILQSDSIAKVLARSHVGIMPMPDITVWRISSPLKLAEYLAAGLMVVGPNHPGNNIDEECGAIRLSNGEGWPESAMMEMEHELARGWLGVQESSLESAESLNWEKIVSSLEEEIARWEL